MTWTSLLQPLLKTTALTGGGANALDSWPTAAGALEVGTRAMYVTGTNVSFYVLATGTDAESSPNIIRPDDYAASTNEKVWKKLTVV
jgi:hypothetical protein